VCENLRAELSLVTGHLRVPLCVRLLPCACRDPLLLPCSLCCCWGWGGVA